MTPQRLFHWSGLAAMVAGVLEVFIAVLNVLLFPADIARTGAVTMGTWQILQAASLAQHVLFLWALVGLYGRQSDKAGVLGLVAFLTLFAGDLLIYGTQWGFFIFAPDLAKAAPAVLDSEIPSGLLGIVALLTPFALAALGLVLFGVASLLAKVFPRWAAMLILAAPIVGITGSLVGFGVLGGSVALGAGEAWMGYFLWTETGEAVPVQVAAAA